MGEDHSQSLRLCFPTTLCLGFFTYEKQELRLHKLYEVNKFVHTGTLLQYPYTLPPIVPTSTILCVWGDAGLYEDQENSKGMRLVFSP